MQSSRYFLFQVCLCLVLTVGSCTCKPLNNEIQNEELEEEPEGLDSRLSEEDLLEEEEDNSRMENLLGSMKEDFLRKLNLSDVPQENTKICPPQFMMELYNKYASDSSANPQSDVIRSFTVQDITVSVTNGTKSKHRLQFNISIPNHEKITTAQLQLFFFPDPSDSRLSFRSTVKVYEVDCEDFTSTTQLLVGKDVSGTESTWETFDVTTAIQSWMKTPVHGASAFDVVLDQKDCGSSKAGCLNMSLSVGDNASAALIVFSDDFGSRRRETKKELREMILHEEETILHSGADWNRDDQNEIPETPRRRRRETKDELQEMILHEEETMDQNEIPETLRRRRRDTKDELRERILHEEETIDQNEIPEDPRRRRRESKKELQEMILHEEESILQLGADWNRENEIPEAPRRRRRKAEREYCRRSSLRVNFRDIGWDSWIVAPPEYDAFECRGLCYHPLTDESTPSKHALIQTLMNIRNPKKANMACCVPIKLDPITVMYQENGRLTIRYLYEEMKVAECGCR